MTLKKLNITGLLILESIISSDLIFSCSFSKAGNLIHLNNLANARIFLPRKFRMKIQKALDIFSSLRDIQLFWDTETEEQFGGELKLIPCFYSHSFWQRHYIRDSETVMTMVCKSAQCGRYQRLGSPVSYSYLI